VVVTMAAMLAVIVIVVTEILFLEDLESHVMFIIGL
jgi:hypothetical protein